jgi:hypothetical protein
LCFIDIRQCLLSLVVDEATITPWIYSAAMRTLIQGLEAMPTMEDTAHIIIEPLKMSRFFKDNNLRLLNTPADGLCFVSAIQLYFQQVHRMPRSVEWFKAQFGEYFHTNEIPIQLPTPIDANGQMRWSQQPAAAYDGAYMDNCLEEYFDKRQWATNICDDIIRLAHRVLRIRILIVCPRAATPARQPRPARAATATTPAVTALIGMRAIADQIQLLLNSPPTEQDDYPNHLIILHRDHQHYQLILPNNIIQPPPPSIQLSTTSARCPPQSTTGSSITIRRRTPSPSSPVTNSPMLPPTATSTPARKQQPRLLDSSDSDIDMDDSVFTADNSSGTESYSSVDSVTGKRKRRRRKALLTLQGDAKRRKQRYVDDLSF